MRKYKIAVIKGDGIGPEVIDEAIKVLVATGLEFEFKEYLMGGAAIDTIGVPLPKETIDGAKEADAILFGAIGGPKWDNLPRELRPESGLLQLRKELEVYANLRPAILFDELIDASPLKASVVKGTDFIVVRELVGGIYFGKPAGREGNRAFNTMVYSEYEVRRIAKKAFEIAKTRRKKICSIDKANVLDVSQLWRDVINSVSREYPDIELTHQYVDNAAMQLIREPRQFDVIVTSNLFGDILSDEAAQIVGSIGLLPSASIGDKYALYEPIHGSAPDIAGKNVANPIATILSASMMLKYSFNEHEVANKIENSIKKALKDGYRTKDIASFDAKEVVGTKEMGTIIANYVREA